VSTENVSGLPSDAEHAAVFEFEVISLFTWSRPPVHRYASGPPRQKTFVDPTLRIAFLTA
jgi:hypothetical protein